MSEVKVNKISPRTNCGTTTLGDSGDSFAVAACASFKTKEVKDAAGNVIISRCGSGITIGSCGAAVSLACGATQTGFGRTGTVDWQTTKKTAAFTAVNGEGYFVDTTGGQITASLPAGTAGAIVSFADYANTFQTNKLIISPNGSDKINGENFSYDVITEGISLTFVYVDSTRGWKNVNDGTTDATGVNNYVTATGGTVTCCGDFKVHTFTGPGTFEVTNAGTPLGSTTVEYLVVAGGAGGGGQYGGGGGAGGFRTNFPSPSATPVTVQSYPITVGAGGAASGAGSSSSGLSITSAGGGDGGQYPSPLSGTAGGSGGGSSGRDLPQSGSTPGGAGNTPPVSPSQGNNGGIGIGFLPANRGGPGGGIGGGGGGGAGAVGGNASATGNGNSGGDGTPNSINFAATTYAGGGGGSGPNTQGCGGAGGGGAASTGPGVVAGSGTANTGGGGGGNFASNGGGAGSGGSGIVVIRYRYQ